MNVKEVKHLKLKLYIFLIIINLVMLVCSSYIMPIVQNYPPNSENSAFQKSVEALTHIQQYSLIFLVATSLHILTLNHLLKRVFKFLNLYYSQKSKFSDAEIKKVRIDCLNVPYKFYFLQNGIILTLGLSFTLLLISDGLVILKFFLMLLAIISIISLMQFIFIQKQLKKVILLTYNINSKYEKNNGYRITFSTDLLLQVVPFIAVSLIIISLIGYAKATTEKANACKNYYKAYLANQTFTDITIDGIKSTLNAVPLNNPDDYYFIITPNQSITYVSDDSKSVSDFELKYLNTFFTGNDGILYEFYGTEQQAYTIKIVDSNNNNWYVGFEFSIRDDSLMTYYISIMIALTVLYSIILNIWSKNISNNILMVSKSLEGIVNQNKKTNTKILPLLSNDEIGDLSYYYNKIEELTNDHIEEIKKNQDSLMEQERLASLGQLIGGISHNLKTPIMSISGAAEGLTDLISEFDRSIGDSEVTNEDFHAIATEMEDWIVKIHSYTGYMSDIITAVKGQAVTLSETEQDVFTLDELIKRVNILMKNELQNGHAQLVVNLNGLNNTNIHGNVNSLVQVVNNLIANAIQSYRDTDGGIIELITENKNKLLTLSVEDHGCGMPKDVQDKLFKEMITTKGKNGTGLGLFMSYSTIKGKFKGEMSFETSEGNGTKFIITLPVD